MSAESANAPPKKSTLPSLFGKILIALVVLLVALAGYIAGKADDFRIERSATIAAPPEAVFEQVNDFHKWEQWSPWAKLDPNAQNTFDGPESGKGAKFRWAGNNQVGEGAMTILESRPNELVKIQLDFIKPMEDTSITEFTLQPTGEQTKITWAMSGRHQNFIGKAFCTLMNMDKMLGTKFEEGLASMKKLVESRT